MAHAQDRIDAILSFWFAPGMEARWFAADSTLDRELAERFGQDLAQAAQGQLDHWVDTAEGALALVILLDQVPRNVFRDKYQAFAFDSHALAIAEAALLRGHDRAVAPIRRRFLYLPFQHSESLADQRYCVSLFAQAGDDPEGLDWAKRHCAVIERFGRFPRRNVALERETSPEEEEYLRNTPPGF
ncbi:MAG TPA: DUF924 family protein [Magnetospirillum sp.]|jgi:uncharacterized protein (DUF924 family)|nr:DUF924 family protein [Magnetospirillum sp.]